MWPSGGIVRTQRQLCRSCDFPAQGCGRSTLPWVTAPTNLATLQELRLAVGVMLNLMVSTNPFLPIILLRVTPTAKRNTYSVATPFIIYTQGRGAARLNPGLRNRNSFRVAAGLDHSDKNSHPNHPHAHPNHSHVHPNHPNAHPNHPHAHPNHSHAHPNHPNVHPNHPYGRDQPSQCPPQPSP